MKNTSASQFTIFPPELLIASHGHHVSYVKQLKDQAVGGENINKLKLSKKLVSGN